MKTLSPLLRSLLLFSLLFTGAFSAAAQQSAPLVPPVAPTNISCTGWEEDTVRIRWKDNAGDEDNYRVERSDNGGAWAEVATVTPDADGKYTYDELGVDVSNQDHRYRLRAYRASDDSYSAYTEVCNNRRVYDPGNFRFFYGLLGAGDDCPDIDGNEVCLTNISNGGVNVYVGQQNTNLQDSADAYARLGFALRADEPTGGLDKIPINIVWCDGGGCAGGGGLGLSPALVETDFDLLTRAGDPIAYLVPLHEAYHFLHDRYWGLSDPAYKWVTEGQARSIQDKICLGGDRPTAKCFDDIATGSHSYVGQVKSYLGKPNKPVNQYSYSAALFWTYMTEKFGTEFMSDDAEMGMDFLRRFWEDSNANPGRDGISIINSVLASLGRSERFRDIFKDFAVASYAKDYDAPAKYLYADVAQTGGNYGPPLLSLDQDLSLNESIIDTDETVYNWGANYYELRPDANVPFIDINITRENPGNQYYTVLGIQGDQVVFEDNSEAHDYSLSLLNNAYDKVVIIVAGLESLGNYRLSINGTQPVLNILRPTTGNFARVGDPAAPDKFIVQVEVVSGDGAPMVGVDLAQFSFQVGAEPVEADHILASAVLMGQEWFVLRAPDQAAAGKYDLSVTYSGGALTDSENNAVDYTPRADADSMITLDHSGSMGDYGKMDAAQGASRLFVDSWRTGDKLGVVAFESTVDLSMQLKDWDDDSRQEAFDAINALTAGGDTRIGDAIRTSWDELVDKGANNHDWAVVLVSDGLETAPGNETFAEVVKALKDETDKKPAIHAVAIGPDADRVLMQQAANDTGGTYQYVSAPASSEHLLSVDEMLALAPGEMSWAASRGGVAAPTDIANLNLRMDYRYRSVATDIIGRQPFFAFVGPYDDATTTYDIVTVTVEAGAAELGLSLSWDPTTGNLNPDLTVLYDADDAPVAPFQKDARHLVWRAASPKGGYWHLYVPAFKASQPQPALSGQLPAGGQQPAGESQPNDSRLADYLVHAALKSDVTMDVFITTPPDERLTGQPIHLLAALTDVKPIPGALILASIETPGGSFYYVWLRDDGAHDDGAADDGLYGGTFYHTGQDGSYTANLIALGHSDFIGSNFVRRQVLSFHMDGGGDRDKDGLPDYWELHFGLDPDDPGTPTGDPDGDGIPTGEEFRRGSDPVDTDTDRGGEGDNSDPDPTDPSDDRPVERPEVYAIPGIGKVFIKYTARPGYYATLLYKGSDPSGPFTYADTDMSNTGLFTDTNVTDGQQVCYRLFSRIPDTSEYYQSPASATTCATPNVDPLPPHGGVLINGGAAVTLDPHVTLDLWASDSVDPEDTQEDFLPPADSASGVSEMLVSNDPGFAGAAWQPYAASLPWTLDQFSGLASVYVKYRDAYLNESEIYVATIWVGSGPGYWPAFLPMVQR